MASSPGDINGLKNVLGYSAASPELVSGTGGASVLGELANKADASALESVRTAIGYTALKAAIEAGTSGTVFSELASKASTTTVGTNTGNIATNTANIATNTANIGTNTASIGNLTNVITDLFDSTTVALPLSSNPAIDLRGKVTVL